MIFSAGLEMKHWLKIGQQEVGQHKQNQKTSFFFHLHSFFIRIRIKHFISNCFNIMDGRKHEYQIVAKLL